MLIRLDTYTLIYENLSLSNSVSLEGFTSTKPFGCPHINVCGKPTGLVDVQPSKKHEYEFPLQTDN